MTEVIPVRFQEDQLQVIDHCGEAYVPMKPIVESIGLDWSGQYRRIKRHRVLSEGIVVIAIPSEGGEQEAVCLPIALLNGWLFGVDASRVKESIKSKLLRYQRECFDVLHAHWSKQPKAAQLTNPHLVAIQAMLFEMERIHQNMDVLTIHQTELSQRLDQLSPDTGYCTVTAYCRQRGVTLPLATANELGRRASHVAKARGVRLGRVPDERFGYVNSYPVSLLDEVFTCINR